MNDYVEYIKTTSGNKKISAERLVSSSIGDESHPVYIDANGKPVAIEINADPKTNLLEFGDNETINIPNGYSEYRSNTPISRLTINYPTTGNYEAWFKINTALTGDIDMDIDLERTQFIGEIVLFGNGETWEISIKDDVIIMAKVG